jgi:hypothetical protein
MRHPNGRLLPVREAKSLVGVMSLHVQGLHVDYLATPRQMQRRGYTLICAKRGVWDLWRLAMCGEGADVGMNKESEKCS